MFARTHLGAVCAALALAFAPSAHAHTRPAAPAAKNAAASAQKQLDQLVGQYYDASARYSPIRATIWGNSHYDDQIGSVAPQVRAHLYAQYHAFARRLARIDRKALDHNGQISYDVMQDELQRLFALERFPEHLLPFNQMDSVPVMLANYAGGQASQPLHTVAQYRAYLSRLSQLPGWIDQAIANMREGMRAGVVQPRALVVKMLPQMQKLAASSTEGSVFYLPVRNLPADFSEADKTALTHDYSAVIDRINPAFARLSAFLEQEYLPAARASVGMDALPDGAAWYQALIGFHTTTRLSAAQIHEIGLKEVARIQHEFETLGPRMGYNGPAAGLPVWFAQQDKYRPFRSEAEVLGAYRELDALLRTRLPSIFNLMPKAPLEIRLEPELSRATASDHYTAPAPDGSRPGIYWSVVNDPKMYDGAGMTSLFMHEGQPGHHFHLGLQQEMNLPLFRKFGGNNAYTEGWGLYAETLGKEMGLYEQPEKYYGHLNFALFRAVRLVVDTGLHAKGWTREQAVQYMRDTLGWAEAPAANQVERYMAWPGQALSYKIGQLKISELRARAEQALGPKFNLAAFHDVILGDGTLPLSLLEAKVDRWIAASR